MKGSLTCYGPQQKGNEQILKESKKSYSRNKSPESFIVIIIGFFFPTRINVVFRRYRKL